MEITANAVQTVTAGSNVLFTETPVSGCCSIIHREGSGIVKLRGLSNNQSRARFKASFGANVALPSGGAVAPITFALALDGQAVEATQMIVTPSAVSEYFNISSNIFIDVPTDCCETLGVKNLSGADALIQNANLIVERVA